jgi:predicted ATPase/class 3 adenylate cyclase
MDESLDVALSPGGLGTTSLPSGVVTFLLSDVEGSTRMWERDEDVMQAAIARHYELLDAAITLHGGVRPIEQGEGDSVVGAFTRPADGVAAALDVQRAFAEEPWPEGAALRIRVALHTGEAQLRRKDYYVGRAIIRCARLRAIAHGGQTILSSATRDLVADRLPDGATLRDLGSHRLKDLGQPEHVWQVCHPDLDNDFPSLRSLAAVASNLPAQLTSFVGREAELAEVDNAVQQARLVTLTGAGGVGKTRLAGHAAGETADRYPDGVRWVELAPVSDGSMVAYSVARTFGLVEEEGRPITDTLCEQLAASNALLILDNCEHVIDACAELTRALLEAAPGLRLLATSREPLGVPGELTYRVPSLDDETGVRLFVERAAQVRPGFTAQGEDGEAVRQICRRLDGLPLAIELAAARVRMMPPARIAAALDDRFRLLTGGARTALRRQQTLETSVAWSHDLLDDAEKALLRRLSVFVGGFTLEAAEAVCVDETVDAYAMLDLLTRLVDKSLVQAEATEGEDRYRLLETIRAYGRAKLDEAGESDATRDRHRDYFLALAERTEPKLMLRDGAAWLDRLDVEWENLSAALEWCDARGAYEPFLRLLTAATLFFELRSHLGPAGRWFARALSGDEGPSVLRARALWGAAHVALYGGDFEAMGRYAPQALAMAEGIGDQPARCRALNINGVAAGWLTEDVDGGRAMLEKSAALGRELGDNWALADGLKLQTVTWMLQEDYEGLAAPLAEFHDVAERLGNRFFIAWYHMTTGWVALHQGDFALAEHEFEIGLAQDQALGGPAQLTTMTAGFAVALLGEIEALTGRYDKAEARLVPFLGSAAAKGDFLGAPWGLPALARLLAGTGRAKEAVDTIGPFVDLIQPLGLPYHVSDGLRVLGAAHLAAGDDAAADAAFNDAKALATTIRNPWLIAHADSGLGEVARRRGDLSAAEALHRQALAQRAPLRLRPGVAESIEALAALAIDQGRLAEGARLLGAASALRDAMGLARWPIDQPTCDAAIDEASGALGDEAFRGAWAEGAAFSLDEAIAATTGA